MQNLNGLNQEEQELESALKSLSPTSAQIDPIAAAFSAGRRSSARRVRLWQSSAALILMLAVGTRMLPTHQRALVPSSNQFHEDVVFHPQTPQPPAPQSLQVLQDTVREKGLDALPDTSLPRIQIVRAGNLF